MSVVGPRLTNSLSARFVVGWIGGSGGDRGGHDGGGSGGNGGVGSYVEGSFCVGSGIIGAQACFCAATPFGA